MKPIPERCPLFVRHHAGLQPALALFGVCAIILAGCGRPAAPVAAAPVEVGIVTLEQRPAALTKELPGRTNAYRLAEVRARVDGIVLKRHFTEGADVTEGQVLYQIETAPYEAALASARATQARADANLQLTAQSEKRQSDLFAIKAISQQAYDNVVAQLRVAEADAASAAAAVKVAQINLDYTAVRAPIAGRVSRSQVTEGAYVRQAEATLLTTIQQLDPIYLDMTEANAEVLRMKERIAQGTVGDLQPAQVSVTLVLEDGRTYPEKGVMQFLDATVTPTTGSVALRALVPNPRQELLPGMFVRGRLEGAIMPRAILVPQVAVFRDARGEPYVFLVGEGDKIEQRSIKAGQTIGDQWLVESGLAAGDRIVVEGTQKVRSGATVRPVPLAVTQSKS